MLLTFEDEYTAVPVFGLNAPNTLGALLLTSRSGSATAQVSVLGSVPAGTVNADGSISDPVDVDQLAEFSTVMTEESGIVIDGFSLNRAAYVVAQVTGSCSIDLSFVANRLPVDLGRTGGIL